MSDKSTTKKPFWLVITIIASQVFFVYSLLSKDMVVSSYTKELELMESVYGAEATNVIYEQSIDYVDRVYIDSGVMSWLIDTLLPEAYKKADGANDDPLSPLFHTVGDMIDAVYIVLVYAVSRFYSLAYWVPMASILSIASIASAFKLREIKKESFQYSSPFRYGVGIKLLYLSPVVIYSTLFIPFTVHPLVFVAIITLICISLFLVISNTIKRL
jgi:hypothetical protein